MGGDISEANAEGKYVVSACISVSTHISVIIQGQVCVIVANALILNRNVLLRPKYLPEPASLHGRRSTLSFRISKQHRWALCSTVIM